MQIKFKLGVPQRVLKLDSIALKSQEFPMIEIKFKEVKEALRKIENGVIAKHPTAINTLL